ncbi:uncharacterized protein MKK02DRAFT_38159 [Dioszegia hungarica]|uniref:Uncharacterized protein n=1 Tax=Dioszegia hungarica TaxID=4972 RepID=A0AA38H3Z0_9TREE|nr:uncharacterized protein MKK02DRAFT_38159 [Dioszegia hungarica]KAI9633505.1 hypothetical protein MKK02DRAFT_38159 [Dioszegia hungarica]
MGFTRPDQATLEQYRDAATQGHKSYWEQNGGSPNPDSYFPGYEAGWNTAAGALEQGLGLPDAEAQGKGDEEWEWKHGFKQGAKDVEKAGSN